MPSFPTRRQSPTGGLPARAIRLLVPALAVCGLIGGIIACGDWKQDPAALTARGSAAEGMGCAACHAYPPQDSNHVYHLFLAAGNKYDNGPITCLACHRNSLQFRQIDVPDTLFRDPATNPAFHITQSSVDWPVRSPADSFALAIRAWPVDTVRLLSQRRPVARPGSPLHDSGLVEFMTGLAHLNDSVDVVFDPKHSDPERFGGAYAAFNPRQETCSAVACHPTDGAYRFAAPAKGLEGLK